MKNGFIKHPKMPRGIDRETSARFTVTRISDGAELDMSRSPRGHSKFWDASRFVVFSNSKRLAVKLNKSSDMKIIQISGSGSTQTSYYPTPVQPDTSLSNIAAEGEIIERDDLVECVRGSGVRRVIQVKSGGDYSGTTGRFFAVVDDCDYNQHQ